MNHANLLIWSARSGCVCSWTVFFSAGPFPPSLLPQDSQWNVGNEEGAVTAGSGAQLLAKVVPSSQALALIEADATMAVPPAGNIRKTTRLAMVPSAVTPRVVQFAAAPHVKSNGSLSR